MPRVHRAVHARKRARPSPTASPKCAKRSTSCATTRRRRAKLFGAPEQLPGPTGESNKLQLHGRGVFVCISPWNFPLAIFVGQIAAALAAGNSVIAKPAEQTNLIGYAAVKLLHEAGVPEARAAVPAGRRRHRRRGADARSARRRRGLHRLDRHRARDQPRAGRARCRDRRADRRDRRPERADRRLVGAARAAGQGRDRLGVHLRRPALLGRARAVRAGRHRRQGRSRCSPARWPN